ncbi:7314_t:CDS:1, partial [Cetraspora pellucida]
QTTKYNLINDKQNMKQDQFIEYKEVLKHDQVTEDNLIHDQTSEITQLDI